MPSFSSRRRAATLVALAFSGVVATAAAQQPAAPSRIRGEIVAVGADTLTVRRTNADTVTIAFKADVPVGAVRNVKLEDLKAGEFVGAASLPDADGRQVAKEVLVFPESARGSNEGHYDWDLLPGSKMTNANVATAVQGTKGRELTLTYKGGSKTVLVPEGTPVVTFAPATRADVVAGKKVFVIASGDGPGKYVANRVIVEKDGVAPPM